MAYGIPLYDCYYYNIIKRNLVLASSYFLCLNPHSSSFLNNAFLDLLYTDISDLHISVLSYPLVGSDNYHSPLNLDSELTFDFHPTFLTSQCNYGQEDYLLLYILYVIVTGYVS